VHGKAPHPNHVLSLPIGSRCCGLPFPRAPRRCANEYARFRGAGVDETKPTSHAEFSVSRRGDRRRNRDPFPKLIARDPARVIDPEESLHFFTPAQINFAARFLLLPPRVTPKHR
jgi:hypothetical protein